MRIKVFLRVLMLAACVFFFSSIFAQEKKIMGVVADEKGTTLPGATVSVKGTQNIVTTDVNGKFSITAAANAKTLAISFVGMEPKEVAIGKQTDFKISLRSLAAAMSEVVVIGYGTAKKANVSSAISSVSAKDLKDLPVAGVDQAIQGKVAGVTVTNNSGQPGGGVSIKVRGVTTINSNDPLIVIDGVPFVSNTASSSGYAGLGGANGQTGNSVMASINLMTLKQ